MNIINKNNRDLGKYFSHYLTLFSNNVNKGQLLGNGQGPSIGGGIIFKYDSFIAGVNVESLYNNVNDNIDFYFGYNFNILDGAQLRYTSTKKSVAQTTSEEVSLRLNSKLIIKINFLMIFKQKNTIMNLLLI